MTDSGRCLGGGIDRINDMDKDYHTSLLGGFPTFKFPTHS